jgi:hypothetical protein
MSLNFFSIYGNRIFRKFVQRYNPFNVKTSVLKTGSTSNLPVILLLFSQTKNVLKTYGYIFIFSFNGYFGLNVVLSLVNHFGALLAVTVTTCRKAITIWLSFLLFAKPFTFQ